MTTPDPITRACVVAARTIAAGGGPAGAVQAAAEALADDPWQVVVGAGALARASWETTPSDVRIDARLRWHRRLGGAGVVVPAGALAPRFDRAARRALGAWDTPQDLARRAVRAAQEAATGQVQSAVDPACGAGAMLVALAEAGIRDVLGGDVDPLVLSVARIACPQANLVRADALDGGDVADLVVANPPFVSPEHQDAAQRRRIRHQFPWLTGRFDLAVPIAASLVARARPGGDWASCYRPRWGRSATESPCGGVGSATMPSPISAPPNASPA